ncbi:MAG TPA: O-antigen ligase family protein [Blastocatellia bacterium]|nr:O-antigen ligase family protein [Blastocatellia bacterium]
MQRKKASSAKAVTRDKGQTSETSEQKTTLRSVLFWLCGSMLLVVPLAFGGGVYRVFVLPKYVSLLAGAALTLPVLALIVRKEGAAVFRLLKSPLTTLIALYMGTMCLSTAFGAEPLGSLFGSYAVQMGLLTRLCFFVLFAAIVIAAGRSARRLETLLVLVCVAGFVVAAYGCVQLVGRDPLLAPHLYTFKSPEGNVTRIPSTLGHSNYLGNFLLYTIPVTAAMAAAVRSRARRIALVTIAISVTALLFSGTRGAWVGLIAGVAVFVRLALPQGSRLRDALGFLRSTKALVAVGIVAIATVILVLSPVSRNVGIRVRSLMTDRLSGSGRTLLWRDSLKMVGDYVLAGCGPDGFIRSFPSYKSAELSAYAPETADESSHSSYIDAAVCFGLPGAILYLAVVICAFRLMLKSLQKAQEPKARILTIGLIAAFSAVCIHNLFIYDQIATGFYFFVFLAFAQVVRNATEASDPTAEAAIHRSRGSLWNLLVAASSAVAVVAVWFAAGEVRADRAVRNAFVAARQGDFDGLIAQSSEASASLNPARPLDYLVARAFSDFATAPDKPEERGSNNKSAAAGDRRKEAIELAIAHAEIAVRHSLSPVAEYTLIAYLANIGGNYELVKDGAVKATQADKNYFAGHWLLAEALLAAGDRDGAIREAQVARTLHPKAPGPISVLARALGSLGDDSVQVDDLIELGRALTEQGLNENAEVILKRAIVQAGPCSSCHKQLALLYEAENRVEEATAEWKRCAEDATDENTRAEATERIASLSK